MQTITDNYRKLNENLHNTNASYGTSGHNYADEVLHLCSQISTKDVLDYGCGKCTLANSLPFPIKKYDPCIRAFHEDPEPADLLVCTDVIEHIEPELLDNVLTHMREKTIKAVYLAISTRPASKKLEDGRNAHLIVQNGEYWFNKISEYFQILSYLKRSDVVIIIGNKTVNISKQLENKQYAQVNGIMDIAKERGLE